MLQRSDVSNPPAFGANIASQILGRDDLKMWYADMITTSDRIRSMRNAFYDHLLSLSLSVTAFRDRCFLTHYRSPWSLGAFDSTIRDVWILELVPQDYSETVRSVFVYPNVANYTDIAVKENYHVYMADNSRVSIVGLNKGNVGSVARSLT